MGNTKVLASVNLQNGVPQFLKGTNRGWLTAEYAMLPSSTRGRTVRESSQQRRNARSIEISRLIGRSLRCAVDLNSIGERTIFIDCDVLQADGGTRTAGITAANIALEVAVERWLQSGKIKKNILVESIAAISVGVVDGKIYLDLSQYEDNAAEVDFNFVLTRSGKVIEIQGTSEKIPLSWENFDQIKQYALEGVEELFKVSTTKIVPQKKKHLFSIGNRL
jgi:ribonuclease PH